MHTLTSNGSGQIKNVLPVSAFQKLSQCSFAVCCCCCCALNKQNNVEYFSLETQYKWKKCTQNLQQLKKMQNIIYSNNNNNNSAKKEFGKKSAKYVPEMGLKE